MVRTIPLESATTQPPVHVVTPLKPSTGGKAYSPQASLHKKGIDLQSPLALVDLSLDLQYLVGNLSEILSHFHGAKPRSAHRAEGGFLEVVVC